MKKKISKNAANEDKIVYSSNSSTPDENPFSVLKSFFPEHTLGSDTNNDPVETSIIEPEQKNDIFLSLKEKTIYISKSKSNRSGKTVTILKWKDANEPNLSQLARLIKTKLGCGGGVENDEHQNKPMIVLQGDLRERVKSLLESHHIKIKLS
ncbi:MAG: translation initiation factor [bacterium]|nr:translation initiation factor [bacterium]